MISTAMIIFGVILTGVAVFFGYMNANSPLQTGAFPFLAGFVGIMLLLSGIIAKLVA